MENSERIRLGGLAALIAGLVIVVDMMFGRWANLWYLLVLALLLLVFAVPQLRKSEGGGEGAVGKLGSVLLITGAGVWALSNIALIVAYVTNSALPSWVSPVTTTAIIMFASGVVLLGFGMLTAKHFPRMVVLLFMLSIPIGIVTDMSTGAYFDKGRENVATFIGNGIFGVSLIWIGFLVWMAPRGAAIESEPMEPILPAGSEPQST